MGRVPQKLGRVHSLKRTGLTSRLERLPFGTTPDKTEEHPRKRSKITPKTPIESSLPSTSSSLGDFGTSDANGRACSSQDTTQALDIEGDSPQSFIITENPKDEEEDPESEDEDPENEEELWEDEVIDDTRITRARFLKKCGVFVKVNARQVWMIYCPVCATTTEDIKFIQGFSGLRTHMLSWHPETRNFIPKMDNKAVIYFRDHCRLYPGQVHLDRLETMRHDRDTIRGFFMSPVTSGSLRDEIDKRRALVKSLIDVVSIATIANPQGTYNRDLDEIVYMEGTKRFTGSPHKAAEYARLESFPTVVKLSSSVWAALWCKICGGNCTAHGQFLLGVDGFRHHVSTVHAEDPRTDLPTGCSRRLFVETCCSIAEVDPRTLTKVRKVKCMSSKSLEKRKKEEEATPGLK